MANLKVNEKNYYSVTWIINNFSYCWQKTNEAIASPIFSIYMPEETKWKLRLFPRGGIFENNIVYMLCRERDCNGAENIKLEYVLEFLIADGSIGNYQEMKYIFSKYGQLNLAINLNREIVLKERRMKYLQEDTLTIRCTIKRFDGKPVDTRQIIARSIINVERKSLLWSIKKFSKLKPNEKKLLVIKSASKEELIKVTLFLSGDQSFEDKIILNIYHAQCMKFFTLQTSLLTSDKIFADSGKYENLCEYGKSSTFPLTISRNEIIKSGYLSNDVLFLRLEFAISTGFAFEGVINIDFGTLSEEISNEGTENCRKRSIGENITENCRKRSIGENITENCVDLVTDLMSLLNDQSLCDAKLQTKTDIFPAHISILSARSPVFRAMFSTDMKEKMNGLVDVSDFDDKTIRRFLLFLYTNKIEEIMWDDALQLYQIADKYEIMSLKLRCSVFLKNCLSIKNSCEILIFSDLHQDEDLKYITQDFILKNAEEIFKSEEWKILKDTN